MNLANWFYNYTSSKSNIYIIPTKNGFKYIGVNFLLFIISISYTNNLALLISFCMATYFVLQMFDTHKIIKDLHKIKIYISDDQAPEPENVVVSHPPNVSTNTISKVNVDFPNQKNNSSIAVWSYRKNCNSSVFKLKNAKRGRYLLDRVWLSTLGNTNLFYVWRYFEVNERYLIYPTPYKTRYIPQWADQNEGNSFHEDEFFEHGRFSNGMSAKKIDWKKFSKTDQLHIKKFRGETTSSKSIKYEDIDGEKDLKLSKISYLIFELRRSDTAFSLRLPHAFLPPGKGENHFQRAMEMICEL